MNIPHENWILLERKFGRKVTRSDQKVTLTVKALSEIIQAAREEERGKRPRYTPNSAAETVDAFFNGGLWGRR